MIKLGKTGLAETYPTILFFIYLNMHAFVITMAAILFYICVFHFIIMSPSVQLYSVYYKEFPLMPKAAYVRPIQAGAAIHERLPMASDDAGLSISRLNDLYSELTAYYWVYKNAPRKTAALGLCHYRRYLIPTRYRYFIWPRSYYYVRTSQKVLDDILTDKLVAQYSELLATHDVILPHPAYAYRKRKKVYTVDKAYNINHIGSDWDTTKAIVLKKHPEYKQSIEILGKQTKLFFNNVMIAPWHIWDDYLNWLFDILFEVERSIELPREGYQSRVMGFLAERLHNLYILHKGYKAAYLTQAIFSK
ncbi:MAG: DUF4422 domain-containing protein [Chitinophagaceae bacterium]